MSGMKIGAALIVALTIATAGSAQWTGSIRLRSETWEWFAAPGDDHYTFFSSQIRVGFGGPSGRIEIEQPALFRLPGNAVLPAPYGQLGLGGSYQQANGNTHAAGMFLKQAFVRWRGLRAGRFEFAEGEESLPKDVLIASLKSSRVAQRLIGPFGFSHVGRSFDALQFTRGNLTLFAGRPTTGVFRVHGGSELNVDIAYAALTRPAATSDSRLFVAGYRDRRDVVKSDNRPLAARRDDRRDIEIGTIGGHSIVHFGAWDAMGWAAGQRGHWGALSHRATAFDAEGGVHWADSALRAGWFRSSGDSDPNDRRHGTFFQMLPTPRLYARMPFYNAMNSDDRFIQWIDRVRPGVTLQSELHQLRLTSARDLWYSGGGAFDDNAFGFSGRPSPARGLARVIDLSADWKVTARTTLTFYAAHASGGAVVRSIFNGRSANFFYVEALRRFSWITGTRDGDRGGSAHMIRSWCHVGR